MSSNFIPMVSSSPPPLDDGPSFDDDWDDDDDFGTFASAMPSAAAAASTATTNAGNSELKTTVTAASDEGNTASQTPLNLFKGVDKGLDNAPNISENQPTTTSDDWATFTPIEGHNDPKIKDDLDEFTDFADFSSSQKLNGGLELGVEESLTNSESSHAEKHSPTSLSVDSREGSLQRGSESESIQSPLSPQSIEGSPAVEQRAFVLQGQRSITKGDNQDTTSQDSITDSGMCSDVSPIPKSDAEFPDFGDNKSNDLDGDFGDFQSDGESKCVLANSLASPARVDPEVTQEPEDEEFADFSAAPTELTNSSSSLTETLANTFLPGSQTLAKADSSSSLKDSEDAGSSQRTSDHQLRPNNNSLSDSSSSSSSLVQGSEVDGSVGAGGKGSDNSNTVSDGDDLSQPITEVQSVSTLGEDTNLPKSSSQLFVACDSAETSELNSLSEENSTSYETCQEASPLSEADANIGISVPDTTTQSTDDSSEKDIIVEDGLPNQEEIEPCDESLGTLPSAEDVEDIVEGSDEFGDFSHTKIAEDEPLQLPTFNAEVEPGDDDDDFGDFDAAVPVPVPVAKDLEEGNNENAKAEASDDDFGDFDGAAAAPVADGNEGWSAFGGAVESADSQDDWAAFSSPKKSSGEPQEEAPSGQDDFGDFSETGDADFGDFEESAPNQEEDDNFGAFETPPLTKPTPQKQVIDIEKLKESLKIVFKPATLEDSVTDINLLISIMDIEKKCKLVTKSKASRPQHLGPSKDTYKDISIWNNLKDRDHTLALSYSWIHSNHRKQLLKALGIDARNILIGHKKSHVPIFASQLGMLEPSRGPLEPIRAEPIKSPSPTLVDTNKVDSAPHTPQESIPPAEFDWSSSGLTNPLDSSSNYNLFDLDFFIENEGLVTNTESRSSALENEFLSTLDTDKLEPVKSLQPLENILAKMKFTSTTPSPRTPKQDENLTSEASVVVGKLPDLFFMRAKVLMFPLTHASTESAN